VADAQTVTDTLNQQKADKADVTFAGQAPPNQRYRVWFLPSAGTKHWKSEPPAGQQILVNDTHEVTNILNAKHPSESTVAFAGQEMTYHLWWRV
jgi:hypothetical protein